MPGLSSLRIWWLILPLVVVFFLTPGIALASGGREAAGIPFWLEFVERFFIILTAGVVAFGILLVEIEVLHWAWSKVRGRKSLSGRDSKDQLPMVDQVSQAKVRRFDTHQRIQHFVLLVSFIILAVTGIPQKFYSMEPFSGFIGLMGGMDAVRLIHRVAGGVMIVDGVYHMLWLTPGLVRIRNGVPMVNPGQWLEMVPNRKDFSDFFQMMGYFLGVSHQPPQFGRFSYMQKFDYWAVFWGLTVMAGSGLIMLLPILGMEFTGTAMIAAALAAHSDEAILAVAWILIVHLYHAHLSPRIFPFNTTIFTGNISVSLLKEEHSLEYARMVGGEEELPAAAQSSPIIPLSR